MAKKKRHKREEKVVFKRPEFDEREFMRKELVNAKVGIITFFYALPFAIVSWQLALIGVSIFGLLAAIIGILSLRYVYPLFNIDVEDFEKKAWLGNGAVFVFTWLSIWVLLLNPPFSDLAKPVISDVQVSGDALNWTKVSRDSQVDLTLLDSGSDNLAIKAKITDNVGISRVEMAVEGVPQEVGLWGGVEPNTYGDTFGVTYRDTIPVTITAWDKAGHKTTFSFSLRLS